MTKSGVKAPEQIKTYLVAVHDTDENGVDESCLCKGPNKSTSWTMQSGLLNPLHSAAVTAAHGVICLQQKLCFTKSESNPSAVLFL